MKRHAVIAAAAIVLALGIYLVFHHDRGVEQERLDEARAALQHESERSRALAEQMAAMQQQMRELGDRVSSLERDNRGLRRRLANSRRPHTEVIALAPSIAAVAPAIDVPEPVPSVEARLVGEPSTLQSLSLTPSGGWPVAEPMRMPAPDRFADPAFMKKMYVSYGLLQAADIGTTIVALSQGGREVNPLLRGISGNPSALVAVKAATSVGTVLIVKNLHKTNPVAAAITLAAINSTLAVVAVNNARAIRAQR